MYHNMNDEDYIMMDDCCMKKTVKDLTKTWVDNSLTDREVVLVCIYQGAITSALCFAIIEYQIAARCLSWAFIEFITMKFIIMLSLFINTMIVLQTIQNLQMVAYALACKCDYREHPELLEGAE
jgi:hypothetical protein